MKPKPPVVDGYRHGEDWFLLECRDCGPMGVSRNEDQAKNEAAEHIAGHGYKPKEEQA